MIDLRQIETPYGPLNVVDRDDKGPVVQKDDLLAAVQYGLIMANLKLLAEQPVLSKYARKQQARRGR